MTQSLKSARFGALLALIVLALLAVGLTYPSIRDHAPTGDQAGLRASLLESPLPGGRELALDDAVRTYGEPVYRPQVEAASDESIDDVWVRVTDSPEVFIAYRSGIVVTVRPDERPMPTTDYYKLQISDGIPGTITQVAGLEAFVVPQDDKGVGLGSIQFVLYDAIITVIGDGDFTTDKLMPVAESIIENATQANTESTT